MTNEEYSLLFHKAQVNLVAFKQINHCDDELRKMVDMAVEAEREQILKLADSLGWVSVDDIRARGNT